MGLWNVRLICEFVSWYWEFNLGIIGFGLAFIYTRFWICVFGSVAALLKAHLSSKLEAPRFQRFLPQKLGSFKDVRYRRTFLRFFKKLRARFLELFYILKKINQNWIKTIGSWHYWYKPVILHIFSVTYLSKKKKFECNLSTIVWV